MQKLLKIAGGEKKTGADEFFKTQDQREADLEAQMGGPEKVVEKEADDVGHLIVSLKEKLTGIDRIIEDEGSKIKNFRESRDKTSNI